MLLFVLKHDLSLEMSTTSELLTHCSTLPKKLKFIIHRGLREITFNRYCISSNAHYVKLQSCPVEFIVFDTVHKCVISPQQILGNFSSVHLSHVELKNMGQQGEKGRYPLHFHICGDVDRKGGYREPTFVDGLSIHHSFSRCLTIHATNGLLVSSVF